jgi:LmbE family N-acetylglucosaminyl deacetylase
MRQLSFPTDDTNISQVLCLGAHSDDIEIGCGGTLLKLAAHARNVVIHWVVFSAIQERRQEAHDSAAAFLANVAKSTIVLHQFRDGFLPYAGMELKECFEQLKHECSPDLILTHYRNDLHQDHRTISELTWNTFRNHLILEYEIPKYDGDFGSPNVFVPLDRDICQRKIQYLFEYFKTQREKQWFSHELFSAILRLRAMEANATSGYAEAFYCRKLLLELGPPTQTGQPACGWVSRGADEEGI